MSNSTALDAVLIVFKIIKWCLKALWKLLTFGFTLYDKHKAKKAAAQAEAAAQADETNDQE